MVSGGFFDVDGGLEDDGTFFPVVPFFPHEDDFDARPAVYVGGAISVDAVVARGDRAVVVLRSVSARPDGFLFQLESHALERWDMLGAPGGPWGPDPNESLRVGLAYPDGTKVLTEHGWTPDRQMGTHGLEPGGGGGDSWRYETNYRAWPLPGPGTLTFVVRWRAMGIEDARYELDASRLIEAARRAEPLWG